MAAQRQPGMLDKELGRRIRERRLAAGVSQERLAESLGVTFQQVQKYEKGLNRISASRLLGVAEALETDIGEFFAELEYSGARRAKRKR